MPELLDLLLTGMDQPQADQPNSLAEEHASTESVKQLQLQLKHGHSTFPFCCLIDVWAASSPECKSKSKSKSPECYHAPAYPGGSLHNTSPLEANTSACEKNSLNMSGDIPPQKVGDTLCQLGYAHSAKEPPLASPRLGLGEARRVSYHP
eukprot:1159123-Pelagomonas_calceolata.AAC.4